MKLTTKEKENIIKLIKEGKTIPSNYKSKLFDEDYSEYVEATKDYKLIYKGKEPKERIIANTPAAPLQKVRSFNSDNYFEDGWQNMLIFGDNLLALKTIYEDQRGPNIYKTKNKIKLIYIDPPFSTKQDFMKDREKAYRDKIIGAQFIEFLRKQLVLLREILADDGSIYVHLDWKKGHYIKAIMDEVFGEHNFVNEIIWTYREREMSKYNWNRKHENIYLYSKSSNKIFDWQDVAEGYSSYTIKNKFRHVDENGWKYRLRYKDGRNDPSEEKEFPRMKMQSDAIYEVNIEEMPTQSFSENPIKENGKVFYTTESVKSLVAEQKALLEQFVNDKKNYEDVKEAVVRYGGRNEDEIKFLKDNLIEQDEEKFKTPLNLIYVSYTPEIRFTTSIFNNIKLFDSFIKSPDKGFYWFPYSYKPSEDGSTHVKRDYFNPDFFLKLKDKNEILVVEIKSEGDTSQKNKAKYRDGKAHFSKLNELLEESGKNWKYYFYFFLRKI